MCDPIGDDDILFADETDATASHADESAVKAASLTPWKVMIVDDEEAIHDVTKLALSDFTFDGRGLEFIHCYSGEEAKKKIVQFPDTALILLDVVMEHDHAGLDVARYVREEADNLMVRIVLRTGQPGQAPERQVITEYDINDYKAKTELTASKLFTLMFSSLRSYRDIKTIEASKRGLEQIIEASADIFGLRSMEKFAGGVLDQMTALLRIDSGAVYIGNSGLTANCDSEAYNVIAGTGAFAGTQGADACTLLGAEQIEWMKKVRRSQANTYTDGAFLGFFEARSGEQNLVYMSGVKDITPLDKDLMELFTRNVSIAFENIRLHEEVELTQREIVYMLGESVETRSKETGNHVKRVAEISKLLALEFGLSSEEAEIVKFASPLHDLGKIGIPDAILNKPGIHTDDEREIMKTHAMIGHDMLCKSNRRVLKAGAVIAREHHERWDGHGYPDGKAGEDIHIYGRISAVADVFDALGSDRCYKKAWPLDKVVNFMQEETGSHFDPKLSRLLLDNIDKIENILVAHTDTVA